MRQSILWLCSAFAPAWLHVSAHRRLVADVLVLTALVVGLSVVTASSAVADVKLPAVLSDGMVLQRGMTVPVWGTAEPGEKVTVTFQDQQLSTRTGPAGRWRVNLKPLDPGGPFTMTVGGSNTITVQNVLVGDVWVCSGQSNMAWPLQRSADAERHIAEANHPNIRLFGVKNVVAEEPLTDTEGTWQACTPDTARGFSAVGYFFGRALHRELGVPIGLIGTHWGGTPAEAWTSRPRLESNPAFEPLLQRWDTILANYPKAKRDFDRRLARWERAARRARAEGAQVPGRPRPPTGPDSPWRPASLFNGMIAPLIPYAIKGAIWYQGESNAGRAYQYRKLFPAMIRSWRKAWGQGRFPFLFVQLANFRAVKEEPADSDWAELREAQLRTLFLPRTAMAVIIDIGEADDIHPRNKLDVGKRLALAALGKAYGEDVVYSGPIYESMTIEGSKIRLDFAHVGGGLVAKGGEPLKGFAIAGHDGKFVWADAKIEGDTVVVWSDHVPRPVAVRYAWADNPVCNLYNAEGLPASPFRTDKWPGVTKGRE